MDMEKKRLAWRLRTAMVMADITTKELAYESGIAPQTVYKYRVPHGQRTTQELWELLFGTIERMAPGTMNMVLAAEEAGHGKEKRISG